MEYIFYGAFPPENAMRRVAEKCVSDTNGEILFYIDDKPDKIVNAIGYSGGVFSVEKIKDYPEAVIVVLFYAIEKALRKIRKMGGYNEVVGLPFLGFGFPYSNDRELSYKVSWTERHRDEIFNIYDCEDRYTNFIITEIIRQRKFKNFHFISFEDANKFQYQPYFFDEKLNPRKDVTVIDCGAYIGDSFGDFKMAFGERLKKVYAFEFDQNNFDRMKEEANVSGMNHITECIMSGVSDRDEKVFISSFGNAYSHVSDTGIVQVRMSRLDSAIKEIIGTLCIKMDIEGYEVAALKGAAELIRKNRPYMAICIYHKLDDILEVPRTIRDIAPHYNFYIRGGKHLECYAIPREHWT